MQLLITGGQSMNLVLFEDALMHLCLGSNQKVATKMARQKKHQLFSIFCWFDFWSECFWCFFLLRPVVSSSLKHVWCTCFRRSYLVQCHMVFECGLMWKTSSRLGIIAMKLVQEIHQVVVVVEKLLWKLAQTSLSMASHCWPEPCWNTKHPTVALCEMKL